jgi:hypothetical protein
MTETQFASLGSIDSTLKPADVVGHLLIIKPIEYKTGITTSFGEAEAIECDVVDLDTSTAYTSILFFNVALRSSLRSNIGKTVLSRMGQGIAKPGKSAPYILIDATTDPEAVAKATSFLAGSTPAPSVPAPSTPAPAVPSLDAGEIQALLERLQVTPVK